MAYLGASTWDIAAAARRAGGLGDSTLDSLISTIDTGATAGIAPPPSWTAPVPVTLDPLAANPQVAQQIAYGEVAPGGANATSTMGGFLNTLTGIFNPVAVPTPALITATGPAPGTLSTSTILEWGGIGVAVIVILALISGRRKR